jgi:hypothetical protein
MLYKIAFANIIKNATILLENKIKIEWYLIKNIPDIFLINLF